ncbi:hypothetical protein [Natrinema halophilum]|uniref:Uncharacterized protein n=1 Tax=Natrinema halophilum TaxID=1699371 RepID=A0A7D5H103_9EURY|nr:hypothetical protein [Natrinema halophilum]QLG47871.1 hypothetical protein HYG82_02930 [Natrinema halophilum]
MDDPASRDNARHDSKRTDTRPSPKNYLKVCIQRLTGEPPRVESAVDVHGRFWLQDRENPDEAYLWSRETIDVEGFR